MPFSGLVRLLSSDQLRESWGKIHASCMWITGSSVYSFSEGHKHSSSVPLCEQAPCLPAPEGAEQDTTGL